MFIQDRLTDHDNKPCRWTYGSGGKDGRFGGAHADGHVNLHVWDTTGGSHVLLTSRLKCRSYRRAVRLLRQHLKGH